MKIVGISVDQIHGVAVKRVTITAELEVREALEQDDVARLMDVLQETMGADKVSREPIETDEKPQPGEAAPAATASRRRRHVNPLGDGETGAKPDPTEAAPQGRRRRAAAPAEAEPEKPATDQAPAAEGSRRRRTASTTESAPTPAPTTEGGRRRRRTVEDAADEPKIDLGSDTVTDVDLTRAASQAAAKIGNNPVKELLGAYEVERVSEIFTAHRERFLRELAELVKKES